MILLEKSPLVLRKLLLHLFDHLLQGYLADLRGVPLEVVDEVVISTEREYVSEDLLQIVFVSLRREGLAVFIIEIFDHLPRVHGGHLASVDVDALARCPVDDLLDFNDQLIFLGFRVIYEVMAEGNERVNDLVHRCILRQKEYQVFRELEGLC